MPQEVLPDEDTDLLFLMYAVLALTVGDKVQVEDVHDTWSAWMTYRDPSHESITLFTQLSSRMKKTDQPFVDAIKKVATRLLMKKPVDLFILTQNSSSIHRPLF